MSKPTIPSASKPSVQPLSLAIQVNASGLIIDNIHPIPADDRERDRNAEQRDDKLRISNGCNITHPANAPPETPAETQARRQRGDEIDARRNTLERQRRDASSCTGVPNLLRCNRAAEQARDDIDARQTTQHQNPTHR
jgi:hypothetical protein